MAVRRGERRYLNRGHLREPALIHLPDRSRQPSQSLRPLVACLAAALGIATAAPADQPNHPADTIVVQNCNDSGPGSLREAYAAASDGDTVDLSELAAAPSR